MSKWFPDVKEPDGLEEARKSGFFGACAFAAMNGLGIVLLLITGRTPSLGQPTPDIGLPLLGISFELVLVLVAAWRFKIGKGAFWGAAIVLLFLIEVIGKVVGGTTNVGWMIAYAAIIIALVNGVRGAWWRRRQVSIEVFE